MVSASRMKELKVRLTLLDTIVATLKKQLKVQDKLKGHILSMLKSRQSIFTEINIHFGKFNASCAAYYGVTSMV